MVTAMAAENFIPDKWKTTPVTVGLLLTLAGGLYTGSGYLEKQKASAVEHALDDLRDKHEQEITNLRLEGLLQNQAYERERTNRIVERIEELQAAEVKRLSDHVEITDERSDELEHRLSIVEGRK